MSRSGFGSFRPCSAAVPRLNDSIETTGCYRLFIWNDRYFRLLLQVLAQRSKFPYHICIIHRNGYWRPLQVPTGKLNQPGDSLTQLFGAAYLARLGKPQNDAWHCFSRCGVGIALPGDRVRLAFFNTLPERCAEVPSLRRLDRNFLWRNFACLQLSGLTLHSNRVTHEYGRTNRCFDETGVINTHCSVEPIAFEGHLQPICVCPNRGCPSGIDAE